MNSMKQLENKIEDYKRFIITLIIVSSYFFIGTIISMYVYHNQLEGLMVTLTLMGLATAFYFILKLTEFQQKLTEEE
ncbi:YrhC-like protein [Thalassobacillus cyri]|uniref:YrhC-like protein n=1 Tax=Thalassobacillus cyri TaxID=571932 RepID=A0A1H4FER7_9BACI|nr:YrhC family protein [Thalassobacillus cyri]SEA95671.1 YrhC-like protein [Thalassobacillus cyri]